MQKKAAKPAAGKIAKASPGLRPTASFQDLILTLQQYWGEQGCAILQPYDMEVGAGTFHPAIELTEPGTTNPDPVRAAAVNAHCHRSGVVTLTCGTWGNVFRFLPPLSTSDELLHEAFDVVAEAFAATD